MGYGWYSSFENKTYRIFGSGGIRATRRGAIIVTCPDVRLPLKPRPAFRTTAFFPDRIPDYVSGRGPDLFSSVSRHFAHPVPPRTPRNICNRIGCHLRTPFTSCGTDKRDHFPMLSVGKTFAKSARDGRDGSKPNYAVHPHRLYSGMAHRTEKQVRPGTRYT